MHDPRELLDWLRAARTGGVVRFERAGQTYVPWTEVAAEAKRVGAHLAAAGIRAGMRVGIRGDNSYPWLVLDLALLGLGAVPVALPVPDFAGVSNAQLARRFGLVTMFAAGSAGIDPAGGVTALEQLLALPPVTVDPTPAAPTGQRLPDDARPYFTLAFSSGTAGRTKCLLMSWDGVRQLIETTVATYRVTTTDRIMIALPLSTFQQRYLCWLAIRTGADIVLTTAARYLPALLAGRPTMVLGPPNFYDFAVTRYDNEPRLRRQLRVLAAALVGVRGRALVFRAYHQLFGGRVRLMLVGSAPVRPGMLEFFARAGLPLLQLYGMTETGYLSWNVPGVNVIGSVGTETYPGTVSIAPDGEVLIRHQWHICLGYEGEDPAEVATVFRGDDTIATGDLGRMHGGRLWLNGRKKNLIVTTGGAKLQLEDLETELSRAAGVNQVALIEDRQRLGLVVWFRGDEQAVRGALRPRIQQLNRKLAGQMQVDRLLLLAGALDADSPLLNRNLKLNRAAVRAATVDLLKPIDD